MTPIEEMSKAVKFLALELPSALWEDVNKRWQAVVAAPRPVESDAVEFAEWMRKKGV